MKTLFFIHLIIFVGIAQIFAQNEINPNGKNIFYYENGVISSEGNMVNGQPEGYWKTYYPTGILKSEGLRKNFLLDSTWTFYNENGDTINKINYRSGLKNGYYLTYKVVENEYIITSKELYLNDVLKGESLYFYDTGLLREKIYYKNGKKHGLAMQYNNSGGLCVLSNYHNGYLINKEIINSTDNNGMKQGTWKEFHSNDKLKIECQYIDNKLHGYYREYDFNGKLIISEQYVNGTIKETIAEEKLLQVEIINTYHKNGELKESGGFINGVPVGIHRQFNEKGKITFSKVYDNEGLLISTGIVSQKGNLYGNWKNFYPDGSVKEQGKYDKNFKEGTWTHFFTTGKIEQIGDYDNNKPSGTWTWYYENGDTLRIENYRKGKRNGKYIEYSQIGDTLICGEYIDDLQESNWFYRVGDQIETGSYKSGMKDGVWKYYFSDNMKVKFEGEYILGLPEGKHTYYHNNGRIKRVEYYSSGYKEREWLEYDESGNLISSVTYKRDALIRIDGVRIKEEL